VDVAGSQGAAFEIPELVEHEQRVIAGAAEVAVVSRAFLLAEGGADAGVDVEHDPLHGAATMNAVDPASGQVSQGRQVRLLHQHLGLKPTHLAGGCSILRHRAPTDDPAHGWISAKPVGIVDVLVSGEPPEDRLAQLSNQGVTAILAGPGVGENLSSYVRQAEGIIEVPKGEQPSVGRHLRTVKLQFEAMVECDPESGTVCFTRRTIHLQPRCCRLFLCTIY
jgi:hypothetical protein